MLEEASGLSYEMPWFDIIFYSAVLLTFLSIVNGFLSNNSLISRKYFSYFIVVSCTFLSLGYSLLKLKAIENLISNGDVLIIKGTVSDTYKNNLFSSSFILGEELFTKTAGNLYCYDQFDEVKKSQQLEITYLESDTLFFKRKCILEVKPIRTNGVSLTPLIPD